MKTLEEYLKEEIKNGHSEHSLCARINGFGNVQFYIHASGFASETLDYGVDGNGLEGLHDATGFIRAFEKS